MVSEVMSGMVFGVSGELIMVQTDISDGLPVFTMIGYLSNEVREAKDRVRTALKNCGFILPPKRISVNLAPADIKKNGTFFDLAIAVSVFVSIGAVLGDKVKDTLFLGELALDGKLTALPGLLPIVKEALSRGIRRCVVPKDNAGEAALLDRMEVYAFSHLNQVFDFLNGNETFAQCESRGEIAEESRAEHDFCDVKGQREAKRVMEIAAAGFHNVFLTGPPGMGKSMLASCMPGIMPEMSMEEKIETTMIYSVKGLLNNPFSLIRERPFRAPSHGVTEAGLFGGGIYPKPGEISLAHHGILFLDELPEYKRSLIEMLRLPLENHCINLVRQERTIRFPADFLLICASNPCLCGYYPDMDRCSCTEYQIRNYQGRISGPILDRIDLFVRCDEVPYEVLTSTGKEESSSVIKERVEQARMIQKDRFGRDKSYYNGRMSQVDISRYCKLDEDGNRLMEAVFKSLHLTGRSYYKVLKVARTIADLDGSQTIRERHLIEAVRYRRAVE